MTARSKTANAVWLDAAETFRKLKASTNGFDTCGARDAFIAGRFEWLGENLSMTTADRTIFKEIMRLGSVKLLDISIEIHGLTAWIETWQTVGAGEPAGSGNAPVLRRLLELGLDLKNSSGKLLYTAARADNLELLNVWFDAGLEESPGPSFSLIKVIEACGPGCAPRIHELIMARADSCPAYSLGHAFNKAIVTGKPKTAAYMRAIGTQFSNTSKIWKKLMPDTSFMGYALERHYRRLEGSAHADMAFHALEPDPVALLGRPKHAMFAGLTLEDLFEQSQDLLSASVA